MNRKMKSILVDAIAVMVIAVSAVLVGWLFYKLPMWASELMVWLASKGV